MEFKADITALTSPAASCNNNNPTRNNKKYSTYSSGTPNSPQNHFATIRKISRNQSHILKTKMLANINPSIFSIVPPPCLLGREALDHLPHYITFDAFGILYLDIWRVIGAGLRCWLLLNIRKYPDHEELIRVGYDLFF